MANIPSKLNYSFTDGQTTIMAEHLNAFVDRLNKLIDVVSEQPTPTQTVATPTISISGSTATISCTTASATIRYTTNGSTPTHSNGTVISSGGSFTVPDGTTYIKAIAYKDGMDDSQVASQPYSPSSQYSQEAQAVINKFSNMSTANKNKVATFVDSLVSAGIYSKINYLMIPMVASSVAEGVQNVLSSVTPSSISNAEIANGGLRFTGPTCIDLTNMMVGTPDYANYAVSFVGEKDTAQTGGQRRILTFGTTPEQGIAPAGEGQYVYQDTELTMLSYKGYGSGRSLDNRHTVCHDDTNKKEFYVTSGAVTSTNDTTTINVGAGIYLGSWVDNIESSPYRSLWHGTYRFFMFTNLLTESELQALENAIGTFIA